MKNKNIFPLFPFMLIPLPKTTTINRSMYPLKKIYSDILVCMYV